MFCVGNSNIDLESMLEFPTYSQEGRWRRYVGKVRQKNRFYVGVSDMDLESMLEFPT